MTDTSTWMYNIEIKPDNTHAFYYGGKQVLHLPANISGEALAYAIEGWKIGMGLERLKELWARGNANRKEKGLPEVEWSGEPCVENQISDNLESAKDLAV